MARATTSKSPQRVHPGLPEIVGELAPERGANETRWQGLTCYRFEQPQDKNWDAVRSLSVGVVAQGRKCVTVEGVEYLYDPMKLLVLTSGMRFQAEILSASPSEPFLSFVLQLDPDLVRHVSAEMSPSVHAVRESGAPGAYVTPLSSELTDVLTRFLAAISSEIDSKILGPIYLREVVYRLLQAQKDDRLLEAALLEQANSPVAMAVRYIRSHISEPLSVGDLADLVNLSSSAFAHIFREVTGLAPYQYVKNLRLEQAHDLIVDRGMGVGEAAQAVGYTSLSHFINEFKRQFGVTPGKLSARTPTVRFGTVSQAGSSARGE